jgi:hypothetical protein
LIGNFWQKITKDIFFFAISQSLFFSCKELIPAYSNNWWRCSSVQHRNLWNKVLIRFRVSYQSQLVNKAVIIMFITWIFSTAKLFDLLFLILCYYTCRLERRLEVTFTRCQSEAPLVPLIVEQFVSCRQINLFITLKASL